MKRIGVLTSGGDAPGMNAAIRAVVRTALTNGMSVVGFKRGYNGMLCRSLSSADDFFEMNARSVSGIIHKGGTDLMTARCLEFLDPKVQKEAVRNAKALGVEGMVCIGGNGTLTGARNFANDFDDIQCIGIPATIDNDINGTDETIGYDTTLNTIMECVDKIRDTAASHERIFFVEVMGRDAGWLAQSSAIASGAEAAIVPESATNVDQLAQYIEKGIRKSKNSSIVIVSESPECGAMHYAERVKKEYPQFDVRVSILGHMQRGGSPSARDRILASVLGAVAVEAIKEGQHNIMVGMSNGEPVYVPFAKAIQVQAKNGAPMLKLVETLSN